MITSENVKVFEKSLSLEIFRVLENVRVLGKSSRQSLSLENVRVLWNVKVFWKSLSLENFRVS